MSEPIESRSIALPSFYVDTAHVRRQPYTVHVLMGSVDLQGNVAPALHLMLSPEFCKELGAQLLDAAAGAEVETVPRPR